MGRPGFLKRREAEGDDRPLPKYGFGRIWYVLTTHFSRLLLANLLAVAFSVPLFTIPAAWTALNAVVQQYYRTGIGDVWPKFFREFKTAFFRRLGYSVLLSALPVLGWFVGSRFSEGVAYGVCAFFLVMDIFVMGWWFPQMSILKLSPTLALRNAFLLIFIAVRQNLELLVISALTAIFVVLLWPVSLIPIVAFLPALIALLITNVVNPVLDERLIRENGEQAENPEP